VRLQGEKYPFFYFYIVFFITDSCCLAFNASLMQLFNLNAQHVSRECTTELGMLSTF